MMGHTDDLSLTGGGGHYRRQTRALTVILVTVIQAGVAMEQCDVRALPHQDIVTSSIRGSLTYTRKLLTVSADFWTEGVGSSKKILKKIINKINKYEENNDKIEKKVNKKIGFRFRRLGGAEVWYDEKENRAMNKDEYCARVDHIKENERIKNQNIKEINYTCTETEQLYGIGYHRVYNQCKDDSFLDQFSVDYAQCLHSHYPWIDMLTWGVCLMKEYSSNFLACFCSTKAGKLDKRSFCITKFECFLHGQGLNKQRQMLAVNDSCLASIEYFTEPGHNGQDWLAKAQLEDKLRVRAPYHAESTCKNYQFSAHFDVGQFVQELTAKLVRLPLNLQVEVFTPQLDVSRSAQPVVPGMWVQPAILSVDQPQCGLPTHTDIHIDPKVVWKKQNFIDIYTERMVTASIPWAPGIVFLYSYLFSDKSRKQKIFVSFVQFSVIILGTYNAIVSMVLWRSTLYTLQGPSQKECLVLLLSFIFACCINYKEIGELYLMISFLHLACNLLLLYIVPHVRTEENLLTCTIISYLISTILFSTLIFLIWHQVDKIDKRREREARWKQEMVDIIASGKSRDGDKRRPSRGKGIKPKKVQLIQKEEIKDSAKIEEIPDDVIEDRKCIECSWSGCSEPSDMTYISVLCSAQCTLRKYHTACWRLLLHSLNIREDRGMLATSCTSCDCVGMVVRLSWYTGLDKEVTAKRLVWDPPKPIRRGSQTKSLDYLTVPKKTEKKKIQSVSPRRRVPELQTADTCFEIESKQKSIWKKLSVLAPNTDERMLGTTFSYESADEMYNKWGGDHVEAGSSFRQVPNNFGTIGSERKAKKLVLDCVRPSTPNCVVSSIPSSVVTSVLSCVVTSLPSCVVTPSSTCVPASVTTSVATPTRTLLQSTSTTSQSSNCHSVFDEILLGEENWNLCLPDLGPPKAHSKILSMIESNKEPRKERKTNTNETTGFIIPLDFCHQPSSAVSYIPQSKKSSPKRNHKNEDIISLNSISYISSPSSTFHKEEKSTTTEEDCPRNKPVTQSEKEPLLVPGKDDEDRAECPPLTRILRKALSGYTSAQIDVAMISVLENVDCQNITIPDFQKLVQDRLDKDKSTAPDIEECNMCLEPLDNKDDLMTLEPCHHVFHTSCIGGWLCRDCSCPMCRAKVVAGKDSRGRRIEKWT